MYKKIFHTWTNHEKQTYFAFYLIMVNYPKFCPYFQDHNITDRNQAFTADF